MVELKKQLLSIFLPRAINTTIVENLKKNKRNDCYVCWLFCVIPSRSQSLSLGKPVQREAVCKGTNVKCQPCHSLTHGWVSGGEGCEGRERDYFKLWSAFSPDGGLGVGGGGNA